MVQSRLNDAHRAATNGAATDAPMETIDWVFVGIGLAFLALWLLSSSSRSSPPRALDPRAVIRS